MLKKMGLFSRAINSVGQLCGFNNEKKKLVVIGSNVTEKLCSLSLHIVITAFQLHFLISLNLDFTAAFVSFV